MAQNFKAAKTADTLTKARRERDVRRPLLLAEIAEIERRVQAAEDAHRDALRVLANWV